MFLVLCALPQDETFSNMNARQGPVSDLPDYSGSHLHKGRDYHDAFEMRPGRAIMWELEQRAIPALLKGAAPQAAIDFATGTGRIARVVKKALPGCRVVGVDISMNMLAVAEAEGGGVEYMQLDGRKVTDQLPPSSFDLATAFRFFTNADFGLRSDAADQLAKLVKPGGLVLVNNHRNYWSPTLMIQRLLLKQKPEGMRNSELVDLFTCRGFSIEARMSLGLAPTTENKSVLPWAAVRAIEKLNYGTASRLHSAGSNTLYLFRKAP
jgi:SAM-dependent methyltransferase